MIFDCKLKVSIIVPIYEHWELAFKLLSSLSTQTLSQEFWECIMVDNGSKYVPNNDSLPGFVKLLHCEKPGSYSARNKAIEMARGELIVFTDADCLPEPTWLESILSCYLAGSKKELIAGGVKVRKLDGDVYSDVELYDKVMGLPQERYVSRGYAVTANLAVPRVVFDHVGCFDDTRFSGGDAEFCRRAGRQGFSLTYLPEAMIYHPARKNIQELTTKVKRVKGGQVRSGTFKNRVLYTIRTFFPPVRALSKIFRTSDLLTNEKFIVARLQLHLWCVEVIEVVGLLCGKNPERR